VTTFRYLATDPEGNRQRGTIEATSTRSATTSLREQGLAPQRFRARRSLSQLELRRQRVTGPELMHMSRQMAAFLRAGLPILTSLRSLSEGSDNTTLHEVLLDIADALREGDSFAGALDGHPDVFPKVYREMVRSSELTGSLDMVLDQLSRYLERDLEARRELRSALTYPTIILVFAIGTIAVLSLWVIPRFESFFSSFGATLPLPTRMLLGATSFLGNWWWALLGGGAVLALAARLTFRSKGGRVLFDRMLLGLPVVGGTLQYIIVERFCRTLGSMVRAGVTLPDAMAVATTGTNNAVYIRALGVAREEMIGGGGIARPITATALFPSSMTQMITAGEDTGTLDEQLENAVSFFEQELRFKIKQLTSLFEPAVIAIVGLVVGFVALALVTAMYGIYSQVQ
jgi:type IV pilus assembly protein PilC